MAYRIEGLAPQAFESLFGMMDGELAARGAMRVTADAPSGFPCRVSLRDADEGEELVLLNHVSHDVQGPFRTTYAIYVRKAADVPASFTDEAPPYLDRRTLSLRGFGSDGLLKHGLLAMPGEADARIRELLARPEVDSIHAHAATYGCFLARIERN
jgi:hypothetical protein